MKRIPALILAAVLFLTATPSWGFAAGFTSGDYEAVKTWFEYDFEPLGVGDSPEPTGNVYLYETREWYSVTADSTEVIYDELTDNKYLKLYNDGTTSKSVTLNKCFDGSSDDNYYLKVSFDTRSMGAAFNFQHYDMGPFKTRSYYPISLAKNTNSIYGFNIKTTQWNHYDVILDMPANIMIVSVNGITVYSGVYQSDFNALDKRTTSTLSVNYTLNPGQEAFIDNFKIERLKPRYNQEEIVIPEVKPEKIDFTPSEDSIPDFTDYKEIENVALADGKATVNRTGLTSMGYRTYVTAVGHPAIVYEFDTLTGEYINSFPYSAGFVYTAHPASDGNVYLMQNGGTSYDKYDPKTQKLTTGKSFKNQVKRAGPAWSCNYGADFDTSMLYTPHFNYAGGIEFGTAISEYNVKTGEATIYSGRNMGLKYTHGATGNDKYIFTVGGDEPGTERVERYDKETGEVKAWRNTTEITAGNMGHCLLMGNRLFCAIRQYVFAIDTETMEEAYRIPTGLRGGYFRVSYPKPGGDPNILYFITENNVGLSELKLDTGEYRELYRFDEPLTASDFGKWVQTKDGDWKIAAGNKLEGITLISPEGKEKNEYHAFVLPENTAGTPTAPSFFYVSPDNRMYIGGDEAGINAVDLNTETHLFAVQHGNSHGVATANGMIFNGVYSSGAIYMLDPAKPVSLKNGNPYIVKNPEPGICRHYNSQDTNAGMCMITGIADYGGTEGGVFLCTYADGTPIVKYFGGNIPNENIVGLEYRDGYIYLSSTIVVNNSTVDHSEEAHIAKIDIMTGETVLMKSYSIPDQPTVGTIGDIEFGPDGLLYANLGVGSTIMAVEPENLEMVKYKTYSALGGSQNSVQSPTLRFDESGYLVSTLGGQANTLRVIDIETLDSKTFGKAAEAEIDEHGNIYKPNGNNLLRWNVDRRQRLDIMIRNAEKYYKEEDYSVHSWKIFKNALSEAKELDLNKASEADVTEKARRLTTAIRTLHRRYDYEHGFAYMLGDNLSMFNDMQGYSEEQINAVNILKQYGIVDGVGEYRFAPEKPVTRAEFVKMLSNAELFDGKEVASAHEFSDVSKTDWSYPYIQNAYEKGWIKGASETEFKPSDIITEEEIILILNRIKENAFPDGEAKPCNRADAAVLIYEFINRV